MCRLYGLQATHPTRPACELLEAQNALIQQSRQDERGLSNPHGWGMGHVSGGATSCFRQVKPASESPEYRKEALETEGTTVLAHVRRATVGDPDHANAHPFRHGPAFLIHNGHIPEFDQVRPRLLSRLSEDRRRSIRGTTDSEHVFALLRQLRSESSGATLHAVTREAVRLVQEWTAAEAPGATAQATDANVNSMSHDELEDVLALNLLWTDGTALGGSRLNRSLWVLQRRRVHTCPKCGQDHAHPPSGENYQSTTLASERLTGEDWTEVPNGSVFSAGPDPRLHVEPLDD